MKKSIFILALLIAIHMDTKAQEGKQEIAATSSAGNTAIRNNLSFNFLNAAGDPEPAKDYDFYMRRSKNYRIVGWSTLIGGVVLSGVGLLIASSEQNVFNENAANTAAVLVLAGAVSGIVSIPFMIMASVNKHKAKLMISNQKTGFGVPPNVSKDIVGVTFKISIGK